MSRHSKKFVRIAQIILALAGVFLTPSLRAQTAAARVDNRLLLIFDTAADMKKRAPAEQKALDTILATSVNGQLHSGDSIGIWTFGRELRAGEFPLQHWDSKNAAGIAAKITAFTGKQPYAKKTNFKSLQPLLNQIVENSQRLTVLIFCDGEDAFSGTPFDAGINQTFRQKGAAQRSARQPFVVALRSQLGRYVGCTVGCPPPMQLKLPEFPPLPSPPAPKVVVAPKPSPPPPTVFAPPLIIVGTTVTNHIPPTAPTEIISKTPPPIMVAFAPPPVIKKMTNAPPKIKLPTAVIPSSPAKTNSSLKISESETNAVEKTNAAAVPRKNPGSGGGNFLAGGVIALAAFALGIFVSRYSRKTGARLNKK